MLISDRFIKLKKRKSKHFIFDFEDTNFNSNEDIDLKLKPDYINLNSNQLYKFYRTTRNNGNIYVFIAKFVNSYIINEKIIIRLTNVQDKTNICINDILSIPYDWIIKVEPYENL